MDRSPLLRYPSSRMFELLRRLFARRPSLDLDEDSVVEERWHTDFSRPRGSRFADEETESYRAHVDGGLRLSLAREGVYAWTADPLYRYRDLAIEATIRFPDAAPGDESVEGPNPDARAGTMALGILFRYINEGTFYAALLSDGGLVRVDAVVNGTPIPILGWTETAAMQDSRTDARAADEDERRTHTLRVIAQDTSVTVVVDDEWVAECADDTIQAAGKVAFAAQNWRAPVPCRGVLESLEIESRQIEVEILRARWNEYIPIPPERHVGLARTWYAMGQYVNALIELRKVWRLREPGYDDLLIGAQASLAQGMLSEAEDLARRALDSRPDDGLAIAELAGALHLQGKSRELAELLDRSPEATEGSAFLLNLRGHLLDEEGDYLGAAASYCRAAALDPAQGLYRLNEGNDLDRSGDPGAAIEAWIAAARAFLDAEEYDDLEALVPLLLSRAGDDARVRAIAGKYRYAVGDADGAESLLGGLCADATDDPAVWYLAGMIDASRGRRDEATERFARALELSPEYPLFAFRLAESLYLAGKECAGEIARALALDGENGWAHNLAAIHALDRGDLPAALEAIARSRALLPAEFPVLQNEAEILRRSGRIREALAMLDPESPSAAEAAKVAGPEAIHAGANLLAADGLFEDAEEWYRRAARARPFDAGILTDRAANCLEIDLLSEADDLLARVLDREPSARAYRLVSVLAARKGEYPRAELALEQGLAEFPGDADLLRDLASFLLLTRKPERARDVAKRAEDGGNPSLAREIAARVEDALTDRIDCAECGREWRVPKGAPARPIGTLHAEPPDELPAGTCPACGKTYCIACARRALDEDGRFRCLSCGSALKLGDPRVSWLIGEWQSASTRAPS